jgi:hypothetical protein
MAVHPPSDDKHSLMLGYFLRGETNVLNFKYCGLLDSDTELW